MKKNSTNKYNSLFYTKVICHGNNLNKIINVLAQHGIEIYNIEKLAGEISFVLNRRDLNKFNSIDLHEYEIVVDKSKTFEKILNAIKMRLSVVVIPVIVIISICLCHNRMFYLKITGIKNLDKNAVILTLNNNGVKLFGAMNFNCKDIEDCLLDKFDISMVSAIKRGNSLIINIKEEIDMADEYAPIIAPCNMIINKIETYSGTPKFQENDIVYEGDVLVESYVILNGEHVDVVPSAYIVAKSYITETTSFYKTTIDTVRSGNSSCINSVISFGKINLFKTSSNIDYDKYEVVEQSCSFSFLLPININKSIAYELVDIELSNDFDSNRANIISQLKNKCYSRLLSNMSVVCEYDDVVDTAFGNIVNYTLECDLELKY